MEGIIDVEEVKRQGFRDKTEEVHFVNSLKDQFLKTEERVKEETRKNSEGGLIRAADAPKPLEPRTFYTAAREYNKLHMRLTDLYNLRNVYQGYIDDIKNMPQFFESPEALNTYQEMYAKISGDSANSLEELQEETHNVATRLGQIPNELLNLNMPKGIWINDPTIGKAFRLVRAETGRYRLDVEDGEKIRKEVAPTKGEKRVQKIKAINYTKYLAVREDGEIILLPSVGLWGIYTGIAGVASWIFF